MVEAEAVVAWVQRSVGPHELLAHEREQRPADAGTVVEQRADAAAVEQAALDRASLDNVTLLGLEPVDPRRQQRLDAGRHGLRDGVGILREHRDQLLDEQRIALRSRDDALVHGRATAAWARAR